MLEAHHILEVILFFDLYIKSVFIFKFAISNDLLTFN